MFRFNIWHKLSLTLSFSLSKGKNILYGLHPYFSPDRIQSYRNSSFGILKQIHVAAGNEKTVSQTLFPINNFILSHSVSHWDCESVYKLTISAAQPSFLTTTFLLKKIPSEHDRFSFISDRFVPFEGNFLESTSTLHWKQHLPSDRTNLFL